jgi:hypothetical protein
VNDLKVTGYDPMSGSSPPITGGAVAPSTPSEGVASEVGFSSADERSVSATAASLHRECVTPLFCVWISGGMTTKARDEKFRRLAVSRGNRLIRELPLLGRLSNRKKYKYTDEEVEQMSRPIEAELVRAIFDTNIGSARKATFA